MEALIPAHNSPIRIRPEMLQGMSEEEFFTFCQDNPQLRLERDADGEIIFMSPSGSSASNLIVEIVFELNLWNRTSKYGKVHESSGGFTLSDGSVRAADVAIVSHHRLSGITQAEYARFAPVAPEFVVEVASPSDNLTEQRAKMKLWLQNGVELGWLIDPKTESLWVYTSATKLPQKVEGFQQSLSAEPTLPGFSLDLSLLIQ